MSEEIVEMAVETPTALMRLDRAEIDVQVATAHRYPRTVSKSIDNAVAMATSSVEIAAACVYTLPPRKGRDGKVKIITGPSIREAEILRTTWGNIRCATRVSDIGERFVEVQGICHDLEANVCVGTTVTRRITTTDGHRYGDDMIQLTIAAAQSVAARNAIFAVVPRVYVDHVYKAAVKCAVGEVKTFDFQRKAVMKGFEMLGVTHEQVFDCIGVAKLEDIDGEMLAALIGIGTAIKEGRPIEDFFPPLGSVPKTGTINPADLGPAPARDAPGAASGPESPNAMAQAKGRRGRPAGSRNKPKDAPTPAPAQTATFPDEGVWDDENNPPEEDPKQEKLPGLGKADGPIARDAKKLLTQDYNGEFPADLSLARACMILLAMIEGMDRARITKVFNDKIPFDKLSHEQCNLVYGMAVDGEFDV